MMQFSPIRVNNVIVIISVSFVLLDFFPVIIIYTKKLLNSDWLREECSSSVTRVQNV